MKGSIRAVVGFLVVYGVVGGMETATDLELIPLMLVAAVGLVVMASGVKAIQENA